MLLLYTEKGKKLPIRVDRKEWMSLLFKYNFLGLSFGEKLVASNLYCSMSIEFHSIGWCRKSINKKVLIFNRSTWYNLNWNSYTSLDSSVELMINIKTIPNQN